MKKSKTILTIVAVTLAVFAVPAQASLYRLVFTGTVSHDALSTDIETYNAHMQGLADAANIGMGGIYGDLEWKVIGSTETVAARDNTGTNPDVDGVGVPIYLVDGTTLVASNNADLWDGTIAHSIDQDENGGAGYAHLWVFSGTNLDGTSADGSGSTYGPFGLEIGGNVQQGKGSDLNQWIGTIPGSYIGDPAATVLPMYAMSEVIPEPATICLLALGGLALLRKKR